MVKLRYISNVVTLELNVEKCNGCGMCLLVCPHAVFALENKTARIVDRDACMECGACALNCPEEALMVQAGVGCACAVLTGAHRGTEPICDCARDSSCCG
jgi:NAD-dependent dihydropyrimidine dehydrogenase PreA subunit